MTTHHTKSSVTDGKSHNFYDLYGICGVYQVGNRGLMTQPFYSVWAHYSANKKGKGSTHSLLNYRAYSVGFRS